ncbi:hypothetical protein EN871_28795 [bacterium M00.F.Ca.ET.228.01.1.1]|nr:hypothetical protein EN871_28795 [bacterium M00.F.Ca.ET.228.01.1.1]TGR96456.1 hypothetical protein EN834_27845 [bacterium M00.F.Ca.ET.191.01.1.1]TGT97692.1 hypothetical protein EN798_27850 [bacterium M00.F.Ca.ET.155.01.1.1]
MRNTATLFTRVLADLFSGKSATQPSHQQSSADSSRSPMTSTASVAPAPENSSAPKVVGQGAENETVVTIGDTPHLFVDEGDHIVQFVPAFDDHTEETEFGLKIVPDLEPHWSKLTVHRCPLKAAIASAIREGNHAVMAASSNAAPDASRKEPQPPQQEEAERFDAGDVGTVRQRREQPVDASTVIGRIASWGEEKFPDRKKPGRFYKSFAIHIDTSSGERTLQGEGLKEAIAECRCVVGDVVSVRRLRKIKVPAMRADGSAMVKDGKPVMWDKWLWSITK